MCTEFRPELRVNRDGHFHLSDLRRVLAADPNTSIRWQGGEWIAMHFSNYYDAWIEVPLGPYMTDERLALERTLGYEPI